MQDLTHDRIAEARDDRLEDELDRLDRLATLMDSALRIPLVGTRIGLDGILGLVPGIGDLLAALPAAWIIVRAQRLGADTDVLLRMAGNWAIDWVVGLVPLIGDIFDIGFKANRRNVALLRRHFADRPPHAKGAARSPGRPPILSGALAAQPTSSRPEKK